MAAEVTASQPPQRAAWKRCGRVTPTKINYPLFTWKPLVPLTRKVMGVLVAPGKCRMCWGAIRAQTLRTIGAIASMRLGVVNLARILKSQLQQLALARPTSHNFKPPINSQCRIPWWWRHSRPSQSRRALSARTRIGIMAITCPRLKSRIKQLRPRTITSAWTPPSLLAAVTTTCSQASPTPQPTQTRCSRREKFSRLTQKRRSRGCQSSLRMAR